MGYWRRRVRFLLRCESLLSSHSSQSTDCSTDELTRCSVVGSDTTSTEIISILYHLLAHPTTYATLRNEIDAATAAGQLSVPRIRYTEAAKLPYLDACCKEGMRLLPSLGMPLPRKVPAGGRMIAGQFFAGGVEVGISATNMHRDKGVFGEDADEFVPERWFREGAGEMEKHLFHVSSLGVLHVCLLQAEGWAESGQFGYGARICIGKNVSVHLFEFLPLVMGLPKREKTDRIRLLSARSTRSSPS